MSADKIRIKKNQKPKVVEWCEVLEITESRFVEDAISFYLRFLEGKYPCVPTIPVESYRTLPKAISIQTDDPEEFDGGIEL